MANIVVACGSGVATSETVVSLIKGFFEDHNISGVNVEATDFKGLAGIAKPTKEIQDICNREGIVDVNGVNILTGNNSDDSYKKILWALQKMTM